MFDHAKRLGNTLVLFTEEFSFSLPFLHTASRLRLTNQS